MHLGRRLAPVLVGLLLCACSNGGRSAENVREFTVMYQAIDMPVIWKETLRQARAVCEDDRSLGAIEVVIDEVPVDQPWSSFTSVDCGRLLDQARED